MSHRSKLYGMYEEEGEFDAIMGMSKADEMLEHLGYERVFRDGASVIWEGWRKKKKYTHLEDVTGITFNSANGTVAIETIWKYDDKTTINEGTTLDFEEIQAINEKCKELRGG